MFRGPATPSGAALARDVPPSHLTRVHRYPEKIWNAARDLAEGYPTRESVVSGDLSHRDPRVEPVPALEQPGPRPEHDQRVVRGRQRPQDRRVFELLPVEERRAARKRVHLPGPGDGRAILAVVAPIPEAIRHRVAHGARAGQRTRVIPIRDDLAGAPVAAARGDRLVDLPGRGDREPLYPLR